MNRNIKITLILIVILLIPAYLFFLKNGGPDKLPSEKAGEVEIVSFSKSGKVILINDNSFLFQTGQVERVNEKDNEFVEYNQTITVIASTQMYVVSNGERFEVLTSNKLDSLRVGDNVIVYGTGDLKAKEPFRANKVDIMR